MIKSSSWSSSSPNNSLRIVHKFTFLDSAESSGFDLVVSYSKAQSAEVMKMFNDWTEVCFPVKIKGLFRDCFRALEMYYAPDGKYMSID